jgi:hypothetical protein
VGATDHGVLPHSVGDILLFYYLGLEMETATSTKFHFSMKHNFCVLLHLHSAQILLQICLDLVLKSSGLVDQYNRRKQRKKSN